MTQHGPFQRWNEEREGLRIIENATWDTRIYRANSFEHGLKAPDC